MVAFVGSVVGGTLSIVSVAVGARTTWLVRRGRVVEVNVLEAGSACLVTRLGADSDGVFVVPVDGDIMSAANGQIAEQTDKVYRLVEGDRAAWIDVSHFVHVEDLHIVANVPRADDGKVVEHENLTPRRADGFLGGQTAEIDQFALLVDFNESRFGVLADESELATLRPYQPQTEDPRLLG